MLDYDVEIYVAEKKAHHPQRRSYYITVYNQSRKSA